MPSNGWRKSRLVCFNGRNPNKLPIFGLIVLALYVCFLNVKLNKTLENPFLGESNVIPDYPRSKMTESFPYHGKILHRNESMIQRNMPTSSALPLADRTHQITSTDCRVAWDKMKKESLIKTWLALEAPILIGAIRHDQSALSEGEVQQDTSSRSDDIVYVIFTQAPLIQNNLFDFNSIDWMCSYGNRSILQKAKFAPRNKKKGKDHVILICNSTLLPETTNQAYVGEISSFDAAPKPLEGIFPTKLSFSVGEQGEPRRSVDNSNNYGNKSLFQYDLQALLQCEHLEHLEQRVHKTIHEKKRGESLVGGCLRFRGTFDRARVPEWIEYHRLLGFQHFWVYIDEGWDLTGLYNYSDVTYIPFDLHWPDHASNFAYRYSNNKPKLSQEPASWHCLYTAKKYGYDWITTTDVDEYVYVPRNLSNASRPSPSSTSLWNYPRSFTASTPSPIHAYLNTFDPQKYSSLVMNSIPFGSNRFLNYSMALSGSSSSADSTMIMPLMIDYVWRQKRPLSEYAFERYKQFYNPQKVWSIGVHYCWFASGAGVVNFRLNPQDGLFLAHYKLAQQGVFRKGNKVMVKLLEELQLDTRLHDDYASDLVEALRLTVNQTSLPSF